MHIFDQFSENFGGCSLTHKFEQLKGKGKKRDLGGGLKETVTAFICIKGAFLFSEESSRNDPKYGQNHCF